MVSLTFAGSYCVEGSSTSEPCPQGKYGNSSGLRQVTDCSPCTPGYYCDGVGLTSPRGLCDPSFYCLEGSG